MNAFTMPISYQHQSRGIGLPHFTHHTSTSAAGGAFAVFLFIPQNGASTIAATLTAPHLGTSASVHDKRDACGAGQDRIRRLPLKNTIPHAQHDAGILSLPIADQTWEVLTALSLSKTQLAEVLGVSRPTLYDWLNGCEPNEPNADRLAMLSTLLKEAGITSHSPLGLRFLRQTQSPEKISLFELIKAEEINKQLVSSLLKQAKSLDTEAKTKIALREQHLRDRGFEEHSEKQRREQLAQNIALLDWPKG